MPYCYLPDIATADVAFEAIGTTRDELFAAAADALTNVMVEDLATVQPLEGFEIVLKDNELDLLLFAFLQELIYYKDVRRLLLRPTSLSITGSDNTLELRALVAGEEISPDRHSMIVDVKAVTLHRFSVEHRDGVWRATVILDV